MTDATVGIIGGSGLDRALGEGVQGRTVEVETPFGAPSGPILRASWEGTEVAVLNRHGPGHLLSPTQVNYRANIYALKSLGCRFVIASGAVGSLREQFAPKHLVIPDQVIDKTYRRCPTFFDDGLAAHVELAAPFCPVLRKHLLSVAGQVQTAVHERGTYVCMEGPAFSTRAESEMHRQWGADLIGMTCMPEAKLAREAEMGYAMICLVSDYDCWRPVPDDLDKHELLKEIISHLSEATANAIELIKAALGSFGDIADAVSPAHNALELAIWSDKDKLPANLAEKYGVLLERYV